MPTPNTIEKAASKVMGTTKGAKGTIKGLTGIFKTLMEEHGEVSALLMRVKATNDLETRSRLWPTIRKELLAHEKGEVAILYPSYERSPELSQLAVEHNEEANRLASLIGQLEECDLSDPRWPLMFDELVGLVQHHVSEEESEIFPAGQRAFGAQAEELAAQYLEKKKTVLASL